MSNLAKLEEIYHAASGESPAERAALLKDVCVSDDELRREVESLLSFDAQAGNLITFYSNRNGKYEIWSVKPDGSNLQMLTDSPNIPTMRYGVWSPDGKQLAYVSGDDGVEIIDPAKDFHAQTPLKLPRIDKNTVFDVWS